MIYFNLERQKRFPRNYHHSETGDDYHTKGLKSLFINTHNKPDSDRFLLTGKLGLEGINFHFQIEPLSAYL